MLPPDANHIPGRNCPKRPSRHETAPKLSIGGGRSFSEPGGYAAPEQKSLKQALLSSFNQSHLSEA